MSCRDHRVTALLEATVNLFNDVRGHDRALEDIQETIENMSTANEQALTEIANTITANNTRTETALASIEERLRNGETPAEDLADEIAALRAAVTGDSEITAQLEEVAAGTGEPAPIPVPDGGQPIVHGDNPVIDLGGPAPQPGTDPHVDSTVGVEGETKDRTENAQEDEAPVLAGGSAEGDLDPASGEGTDEDDADDEN